MWCANCKTEVAAEVSLENDRTKCAICGAEGTIVVPKQSAESTRNAEELLRRWSSDDLLDPFGPPPRKLALPNETMMEDGLHQRPSLPHSSVSGPSFSGRRVDPPISPENYGGHSNSVELPPETAQPRFRQDQVHAQSPSSPHIPIDQLHAKSKRNTNWQSAVGQVMAYFGVGILTVGTVVVLIGYFGGPPNYAPTGWLITIFGQMLLFIGVITLVSGGMEQTTLEVARRIDSLSAQLQRLEQASRDPLPPSPKLPPSAYTGATLSRSRIDQRESLRQ